MANPNTNRPAPPLQQRVAPIFLDLAGWNVYDWIFDSNQGPYSSSHGLPWEGISFGGTTRLLEITGKGVLNFALFGMENRSGVERAWQGIMYIDGAEILSQFRQIPPNKLNYGVCFAGVFMLSAEDINIAGYQPTYMAFEQSLAFDVYHEGTTELATRLVYDVVLT